MGVKIECDGCGEQTDRLGAEVHDWTEISIEIETKNREKTLNLEYDFCSNCTDKFKSLMPRAGNWRKA